MLFLMWAGPRPLPSVILPDAVRNRNNLTVNLFISAIFAAVFALVYITGNWIYLQAPWHYDVHIGADDLIPFVPSAAIPYLTINLLLLLAPFLFREPDRLLPFGFALVVQLCLALAIYSLFPVEALHPRYAPAGVIGSAMALADAINLDGNTFPSLHVALAMSAAWAYSPLLKGYWRLAVWSWTLTIVLSTLLTRQHSLIDAAGGAALAIVVMATVYPRAISALAAVRRELLGPGPGPAGEAAAHP
jgi:hypothetical protein